jgi:hypothetical protein
MRARSILVGLNGRSTPQCHNVLATAASVAGARVRNGGGRSLPAACRPYNTARQSLATLFPISTYVSLSQYVAQLFNELVSP